MTGPLRTMLQLGYRGSANQPSFNIFVFILRILSSRANFAQRFKDRRSTDEERVFNVKNREPRHELYGFMLIVVLAWR